MKANNKHLNIKNIINIITKISVLMSLVNQELLNLNKRVEALEEKMNND